MNEHKISFIICWNNEYYLNECKLYLEELEIPEGYMIEIIEIANAYSMPQGYNQGMKLSDAKYKVYMHQDVFITNKFFLTEILNLFQQDKYIGLLGLVGTPYLYHTGIMWEGVRVGGFYRLEESLNRDKIHRFLPLRVGYMEVEAVDGLLLATQYDLPWRSDLFKGWDFYDISQCFEFRKAGYKVVIPGQSEDWYIHDCGMLNLSHYNEACESFLNAYAADMKYREEQTQELYMCNVFECIEKGFHGAEEEKRYFLNLAKILFNRQ